MSDHNTTHYSTGPGAQQAQGHFYPADPPVGSVAGQDPAPVAAPPPDGDVTAAQAASIAIAAARDELKSLLDMLIDAQAKVARIRERFHQS